MEPSSKERTNKGSKKKVASNVGMSSSSKKKTMSSTLEKSATGHRQSLASRNIQGHELSSLLLKKTPSDSLVSSNHQTILVTPRAATRTKKSIDGAVPLALTSKKSLMTVLNGPSSSSWPPARPDSGQSSNRWTTTLTSTNNSIPIPPSKRLEQVRLMNHIIHGYKNGHGGGQRVVDFNEKNSYPSLLHQTSQRRYQKKCLTNNKQNPSCSDGSQKPQQKYHKIAHHLQPPIHIPGPKRENIYIGQYDGSDSDSDPGHDDDHNEDKKKKLNDENKETKKYTDFAQLD